MCLHSSVVASPTVEVVSKCGGAATLCGKVHIVDLFLPFILTC